MKQEEMRSTKWKELLKSQTREQDRVLRIDSGNEMKMMRPYLEAMSAFSAANCLKPGYSSLFLSLVFAEVGMESEISGFFGPSMKKLSDHIKEGLIHSTLFEGKADIATSMMLSKIVKLSLIVAIAAGSLLKIRIRGSEKEQEVQKVYMKLFFTLTSSSDFFKTALKELSLTTGCSEKIAEKMAIGLSSIVFLLMGYTAASNNQSFQAILEILSPYFEEAIKTAEEFTSEANEWGAHLTKLKLSLKNASFEDFINAFLSILETIGIEEKTFKTDSKKIEEMAIRIEKAQNNLDSIKSSAEMSVMI